MEGFGVLESLGKITDIAIVSYNQNDLSDDIGWKQVFTNQKQSSRREL